MSIYLSVDLSVTLAFCFSLILSLNFTLPITSSFSTSISLQVLQTMKTLDIAPSSHTKSLLISLYSTNGNLEASQLLIISESDETVTPYMFSSAVSACGSNWQFALELLQRACVLNKADEAVFTATAKCCAKNKKYLKSFRIIDAMMLQGLEFNKYSFSFIINACLEYQLEGEKDGIEGEVGRGNTDEKELSQNRNKLGREKESEGKRKKENKFDYNGSGDEERGSEKRSAPDAVYFLEKYLTIAQERTPYLLTSSVCQKVIKDLLLAKMPSVAAMFHLSYLSKMTCKSETLGQLLSDLQEESEKLHIRNENEKIRMEIDRNRKHDHENKNDNQSVGVSEIEIESQNIDGKLGEGDIVKNTEIKDYNDYDLENLFLEEEKEIKIGTYIHHDNSKEIQGDDYNDYNVSSLKNENDNGIFLNKREEDMRALAERGLALVALYCSTGSTSYARSSTYTSDSPSSSSSSSSSLPISLPRRHLLRISHFNR